MALFHDRGLDPDLEDAAQSGAGSLIHFVEFAQLPTVATAEDPTGLTMEDVDYIERTQVGLVDYQDFSGYENLDNFEVTSTGYRKLSSPPVGDPELGDIWIEPGVGVKIQPHWTSLYDGLPGTLKFHWPGLPDLTGLYVQGRVDRDTRFVSHFSDSPPVKFGCGNAGVTMDVICQGSTSQWNEHATSSGGGQDYSTHCQDCPRVLDMVGDWGWGYRGYTYPDQGFGSFGSMPIDNGGADPADVYISWSMSRCKDSNTPGSCFACACDDITCFRSFDGLLTWRGVVACTSGVVCFENLPLPWDWFIRNDGILPIMDSGIKGTMGSIQGPFDFTARRDGERELLFADGYAYPYRTVSIREPNNLLTKALDPQQPAGVWGGDCYRIVWQDEALEPTPIEGGIQFTTSDVDLSWDGKEWLGLGREGLAIGPIHESGDLKAQGVRIQLPAVNLATVVQKLKTSHHRGGIVRIWAAKYDDASGSLLGEPVLLGYGYSQGGWVVKEEPPDEGRESGEDAAGTAIIEGRITSRLANLDRATGITAAEKAHQIYYPGDTYFRGREQIFGLEIPWGTKGRNPPVGTGGSSVGPRAGHTR